MQEIYFYCQKCKKSLRLSYSLCGDDEVSAMNGITIRCHTNRCTKTVCFKKFTEGQIRAKADAFGKCYL